MVGGVLIGSAFLLSVKACLVTKIVYIFQINGYWK